MTSQEARAAHKIAALMRAARKKLDLTQVEVAQRLQISQSALSKIESGLLIPSAPQWFEFCELTGILPDSLNSGFIERVSPAVLENGEMRVGFKVPKAYRENRGSKARAMLPFVEYLRATLGEEKFEAYFRSIKMDSDLFTDLDTQLSLKFCLDLGRTLISQGHLKKDDFSKLTASVSQSHTHGKLHRFYDSQHDPIGLMTTLIAHARQYECNFQYRIEDQNKSELTLSIRPEEHLSELSYRDDSVLGDFLCQYKKHYFERFTHYGGNPGASLHEVACHYKGAPACVYQLKMAG